MVLDVRLGDGLLPGAEGDQSVEVSVQFPESVDVVLALDNRFWILWVLFQPVLQVYELRGDLDKNLVGCLDLAEYEVPDFLL